MFKKLGKSLFNETESAAPLADRPSNPFATDLMNAIEPHAYELADEDREEEPETIIAEGVSIKGTMSFQKLLRIDGRFEGELESNGSLIIGPNGSVTANLNLEEAFISGKLIGDITVKKRLVLRGRAEIHGNINAPILSVDEGVSIVGMLNIVQEPFIPAPSTELSDEEMDHYSSDN